MKINKSLTKAICSFICLALIATLPNCFIGGRQHNMIEDHLISDISIKSQAVQISKHNLRVESSKDGTELDSNEYLGIAITFVDSLTGIRDFVSSNVGLINSAYATDPSITVYNLLNPIDSITFKTLHNLDLKHKAGTDVTKLFGVYRSYRLPASIEKFDTSTLNHQIGFYSELDFVLTTKPEVDSVMQFEVRFHFADSTIKALKTEIISVK